MSDDTEEVYAAGQLVGHSGPYEGEEGVPSTLGEYYLPPISRIVLPKTTTQTALVRWLARQGYSVKAIHNGLNIRYQQVRNMVTMIPKRMAREDLPPDGIKLQEVEDIVDMLLGDELERTFAEAKKQERRARRNNEELEDEA